MKKVVAVMLTVVLLLGVCSINAYADAASDKCSPELLERLATMADDEKVEVFVSLSYHFGDSQAAYEAANAATGIDRSNFKNTDEVRDYYQIWRSAFMESKRSIALAIMAKMGVTSDDVTEEQEWNEDNIGTLGVPNRYSLNKAQIETVSKVNEVTAIDLYTGQLDTDDDPTDPDDVLGGEGYYLVGNMTGWSIDRGYRLSVNPHHRDEYLLSNVYLTPRDEFKVVYSPDGEKIDEWFPDGMDNNCTLAAQGIYVEDVNGIVDIYFRPDMDGSDDWYYGCLYAELVDVPEPMAPTEPPSEEPTEAPEPVIDIDKMKVNRYEDAFSRFMPYYRDRGYIYNELYVHRGESDSADWALVQVRSEEPIDGVGYGVFDEIVMLVSAVSYPFDMGYGVYDVGEDTFYSITKAWNMGYEDLHDVFVHLMTASSRAYCLGDADRDGELSIIDVTYLQRYFANMIDLKDDDVLFAHFSSCFGPDLTYLSDFDCNGEREIIDATLIQRHLVGLSIYPHSFTASAKLEKTGSTVKATASSSFTEWPVQYRYTIKGSLNAYSDYGDDLGKFTYHDPDHVIEPGTFYATTGYIDDASVEIPIKNLTYGDSFELAVTARDQRGHESKTVLRFNNAY